MLIQIAKDFSDTPAGRFRSDGPWSGEKFREDLLLPALKRHEDVQVDLDDTEGFGSSFLEEAFGGLIRLGHLTAAELHQKLKICATDDSLIIEIWDYVDSATPEK